MSTGLEHGIITNTGTMSKDLGYNIFSNIGTMVIGLGQIMISDMIYGFLWGSY